MSLINFETGEIVEGEVVDDVLSAVDARKLTDEIRQTLRVGHDLVIRAFKGRAWTALGYPTWDAYCSGEFAEARMIRLDREQRREIVADMRREGMSNRAIASGIGADYKTVMRDAQLVQDGPVDVVGIDGRRRENKPPANAGQRFVREEVGDSPASGQRRATRRAPLPDFARDAADDLLRICERLERIANDDRFSDNRDAIAHRAGGSLNRSAELLERFRSALRNDEATP